MKKEILFEAIGNVDDALLARLSFPQENSDLAPENSDFPPENSVLLPGDTPKTKIQAKKRFAMSRFPLLRTRRYALALCAACLIFAAFSLPKLLNRKNTDFFRLSDASYGVTVSLMENAPETMVNSSSDLVWLTEEELFTYFHTDIFEGNITDIQNIVLDFNGEKDYGAIASIRVEKVFRGSCQAGDTVKVLLPCMIDVNGVWVSDTGVVSEMRAGMRGIFMPMVYDALSFREQNGARLSLADLAPYGFADGERYCFLETQDGLVFARFAYESIAEASTLGEIERYIEKMLEDISEE